MSFQKGPSRHLSWDEMACKDGTPYPLKWRPSRAIELAEIFELIRFECGGKPIQVLSAYRTESHNKKINGAKNSQHLQGKALDLKPPKGMKIDEFYNLIKGLAKVTKIKGIGKYKTFVHVDIRQAEKVAYWFGYGTKDSLT